MLAASGPRFPDVTVRLTECNGNAFAIIGEVVRALKRSDSTNARRGRERAAEWTTAALKSESYDALPRLALSWVNVQ